MKVMLTICRVSLSSPGLAANEGFEVSQDSYNILGAFCLVTVTVCGPFLLFK